MDDFGFVLMNTAKNLRQDLAQALAAKGITVTQWAVLAALARLEQATAAALVTALGIDKPTMSGVVKRLGSKAWLLVSVNPDDHRSRLLQLSAAGYREYVACLPLAQQVTATFLAPLGATDRVLLQQLLQQLDRED